MKASALYRILVPTVLVGAIALYFAPIWTKSAEEVFAEVARSVVVVLALDSAGDTDARGSGVVVGENEVVTNCHVIEGASSIAVRQAADSGGDEAYRMDAQILAREDERDLCLLFVTELADPPAAPVVPIGNAKDLAIGETVYAIGSPHGLDLTLSQGIVSQLRGRQGKAVAPLIQTDTAISPGSSGGGLFNNRGALVGITTFKWRGENLNFALPAEWLTALRQSAQAELRAAQERKECTMSPNHECVLLFASFVVRRIPDKTDRAYAYQAIAVAQIKAGDQASARDTIATALADFRSLPVTTFELPPPGAYDLVWRNFAPVQAEAGDIGGALSTAQSVTDSRTRDDILHSISSVQAGAGDIDGALSTTQSIADSRTRDRALHGIASVQASAGDVAGAFATVRSIDSSFYRAHAKLSIAAAQAETGDIHGAFTTTRSIEQPIPHAGALRVIASAQAETGDVEDAFSTVRSINLADARANALSEIATVQAAAGDTASSRDSFAAALSVASSISSPDSRAGVLHAIAVALMGVGQDTSAQHTLDAARAAALKVQSSFLRYPQLRNIMLSQVEAGDLDGAFATMRSIDDSSERDANLSAIASAQAEAGDIDGAFATTRSIAQRSPRADALRAIASAQVEAGDSQGAMRTAMGIEDIHKRALALAGIAESLATLKRK